MLTPKRKTWFLVADGAKARLFESCGPNTTFTLQNEWLNDEARTPDRDLGRERPVRSRTIGTGAPYAIASRSSPHDKAEEAFLAARAHDINEGNKKQVFDQLVICAPPAALGILRKRLATEVNAAIIGIVGKDLTNSTEADLQAYFVEKLERW